MAIGALAAAGAALVPSIFNAIRSGGQRRRADQLRASAVDPGYQMNQGVLQNASVLQRRASNYQIPGYAQALQNINQSYGTAFNQGVQGASSSGDVLSLAANLAYGQGQAQNQLAGQSALGRDQALMQSLNATAAAGQEGVNKNAYDRQRYEAQLREAAALYGAGETNLGNAIGDVGTVASAYLMNLPARNKKSNTTT